MLCKFVKINTILWSNKATRWTTNVQPPKGNGKKKYGKRHFWLKKEDCANQMHCSAPAHLAPRDGVKANPTIFLQHNEGFWCVVEILLAWLGTHLLRTKDRQRRRYLGKNTGGSARMFCNRDSNTGTETPETNGKVAKWRSSNTGNWADHQIFGLLKPQGEQQYVEHASNFSEWKKIWQKTFLA